MLKHELRKKGTAALIAGFAMAATPLYALVAPDWHSDYHKAVEQAKREGKPMIVDFSTSWCPNCRVLEKTTLRNPVVTEQMKDFVKVYVDGDKNADIVSQFGVDAYPTVVMVGPKGDILNKQVGAVKPDEFVGLIDGVRQTVAAQTPAGANGQVPPPANGGMELPPAPSALAAKEPAPKKGKVERLLSALRRDKPAANETEGGRQVSAPAAAGSGTTGNRDINFYTLSSDARREGGAVPAVKPRIQQVSHANPLVTSVKPIAARGGADDENANDRTSEVYGSQAPVVEKEEPKQLAQAANDLPRPLLNAGATREIQPAGARARNPVPSANTAAEPAQPQPEAKAPAPKSDAAEAKPAAKKEPAAGAAAASGPKPMIKGLGTLRKLQGNGGANSAAVAKKEVSAPAPAEVAKAAETTPAAEEPAAPPAPVTEKPAEPKTTTAKAETAKAEKSATETNKVKLNVRTSGNADTAAAETGAERGRFAMNANASAPAAEPPSDTTAAAEPSAAEPPAPKSTAEVNVQDIERWIKDADSKLVAGKKREALAMYTKVVNEDEKNVSGVADRAFIQMVALIVDRDDDKLRQKAYDKITEFSARFPNSPHKDHYTVIRAMMAADLGKYNEAHSLLDDFPDRFKNSRYAEMAYDTWKSLPPANTRSSQETAVRRPTNTRTQ